MRDYDLVITSVKRILKFNSKDFVMGYILSIWDWGVIDDDDYSALKDLIDGKGEID